MQRPFDDAESLGYLIAACREITNYIGGMDEGEFLADSLVVSGVCWQFAILGEAASRLSTNVQEQASEVPWRLMRAMRNALVHGFDRIDLHEVWTTAAKDVPGLSVQLSSVRALLF